jgi:gamma-glutamyltranspeptidase/glutathione hydrolase
MTKGAAVAAGCETTAEAAASVLRAGGNAFDAAIAGLATACIAEPVLCSLFGGGFLLARPAEGEARIVDFFTQTPGRAARGDLDFHAARADFGTATQEFHIGRAAAAVPGMTAGLFHIHETLGRMPLRDALAPALAAARDGVVLGPLQAAILEAVRPIFTATEEARRIYCDDGGGLLGPGARHRPPGFADFLDALIREGPRLVHEGEVAARIADLCRDGGLVTAADLKAYSVATRPPRRARYRGAPLLLNDLPSSGGPLIEHTLSLLERGGPLPPPGRPERTRRLIDALARTGDARRRSGFADDPSPETAAALFEGPADDAALKTGGTTHISIVDGDGALASLSLSNGEGNGVIVPGTGLMLNNMLGEEDLNPLGFFKWRPNTRVTSMMTPCVIDLPGGREVALGSGGSNRIRSAIVRTLSCLIDDGLGLYDAVAAPRVHVEGGEISIEDAADGATTELFPEATFWPAGNFFFGGVHAAGTGPAGASAAGDPRRGGHAIVL